MSILKKKADFSRDKRWGDGERETKTEVRDSWQHFLSPWIQQLESADNSEFHMNWDPWPFQTFATLDWHFVTYHQMSAINTLILLVCKSHFHKVRTWHSTIIVNPCQRFTKLIDKEGSRVGEWIQGRMQNRVCVVVERKNAGTIFFFSFWLLRVTCRILVLWSGIEHMPPAVEIQNPNQCTATEIPTFSF